MNTKNRYLARISYLGKNYCGSQKQPSGNTIQDEVEKALCTLIKTKTSTIFSGRTDAGVSAKSQTFHFDTSLELDTKKFINSLNGILPEDIRVFEIKKVENTFHAQKSAKFRHYRYLIRNDMVSSPFDTNVLFVKWHLDEKLFDKSLKCLVGEYDFSAFKSKSDNPACVCNIYHAGAFRSDDGKYIVIDIIGSRFLYNMVRTIVGTLFKIQKDALVPLAMAEILSSKDRNNSGATAPAIGLTLEYVGYDDCLNYLKQMNIGKANK